MQKILIVEDDMQINKMLQDLLKCEGYMVISAFSGTEGLMNFKYEPCDLILLDLMLPGKMGYEVLEEVRETSHVPVIVLTAIEAKESTVSLLRLGANDYVTKPFDNQELLARIEVQLRQNRGLPVNQLRFKELLLELDTFEAFLGSEKVNLSKREFDILKCLMEHPKRIFSKNNLYEKVWEEEFYGQDNIINVNISKIRSKLASVQPETDYIQTVWGIGFKMNDK